MGWISDVLSDIRGGDYLFLAALSLLVGYALWRAYWGICGKGRTRPLQRFAGLSFQIGLTLMFERLYEFSRAHIVMGQGVALAYSNADRLWQFELQHGFFVEQSLESLFIHDALLMRVIYGFYVFAHLFVTLSFLIWMYMRRHESFAFVRNMFYTTTGVALVIYIVFPTSPPRFFSNLGFVDPERLLGWSPAGGADATSQTLDVYAAFPSLHLVYALIVGATLVIVGRRLWLRAAGLVYPIVMLAVILISANHWILDAVGAVVVVAGSASILWTIRWMVRQLPPIQPLLATPFRRTPAQRTA